MSNLPKIGTRVRLISRRYLFIDLVVGSVGTVVDDEGVETPFVPRFRVCWDRTAHLDSTNDIWMWSDDIEPLSVLELMSEELGKTA